MTSAHQKAAQMLAAAADLLDQGQSANRLSLALTAIAVAVLLIPSFQVSTLVAVAIAVAGIVEFVFAIRVRFDAALFRRLATDAAADRLDLSAFDAAMSALRLMPVSKAGRPIEQRIAGAKVLLAIQGAALLVQIGAAAAGGIANLMER
jgi:hypothetical protein